MNKQFNRRGWFGGVLALCLGFSGAAMAQSIRERVRIRQPRIAVVAGATDDTAVVLCRTRCGTSWCWRHAVSAFAVLDGAASLLVFALTVQRHGVAST